MNRITFYTVFILAIATPTRVFAQISVQPGKWELTSTFKGLPFGDGGERTHTVCLTQTALQTIPEKALIEASPPPSDGADRHPSPRCDYLQVRRDGAKSSWSTSCSEPKATGSGNATVHSPQRVELHEELEVKMGFKSRQIRHDIRARRVGDCP
ncbi:DUF3617 domain-containing protein [Pseudoxanthomonas sacheonensis]|uniref:DUF3617 family protein n=1 Tax=Pseudoxanthomonas sacheonensis TaxID=443615 RepID=A0ABU1RUX6_9GAMM|nr:DUF3617 family protein [Pseudoxanthomonas sacheonensis]MDR6842115.1 hypothetical protein [Pseudoxanthomonas sacheonensis]